MKQFGIIGKPLSHSFSPDYFQAKFNKLQLGNHVYSKFELDKISDFYTLKNNYPNLIGLNVTIPYKTAIIPFLDSLGEAANEIGAVNTLCFNKGHISGHNTDVIGFESVIKSLQTRVDGALILGSGGASKAIQWVLARKDIPFKVVSRQSTEDQLSYNEIDRATFRHFPVIINCTPMGMHPNVENLPPMPYQLLSPDNILIDLVYNPKVTKFLGQGLNRGCRVKNGLEMLVEQAEASWKLWRGQ